MKKSIIYLLLISIFLFSCKTSKKMISTDTIVSTESNKKDSTKTIVVNQVINDKVITPVVQSNTGKREFDSLVNAKVDEILLKLNTSKSSGDNSYQLLYNQFKKQLEFYSKIAQTKNEDTKTNSSRAKTIIRIKKIPVLVEKPRSKLEKFVLLMGCIFMIFIVFKIFTFIRKKATPWQL
jgi:hypothetical protein